jgi:hypothetical protein
MQQFLWLIYLGLALMLAALGIKLSGQEGVLIPLLFMIGGSSKLLFMIMLVRRGGYKPGLELLFLGAGVSLLILGGNLQAMPAFKVYAVTLIIAGVLFKMVFLYSFYRKIRLKAITKPDRE